MEFRGANCHVVSSQLDGFSLQLVLLEQNARCVPFWAVCDDIWQSALNSGFSPSPPPLKKRSCSAINGSSSVFKPGGFGFLRCQKCWSGVSMFACRGIIFKFPECPPPTLPGWACAEIWQASPKKQCVCSELEAILETHTNRGCLHGIRLGAGCLARAVCFQFISIESLRCQFVTPFFSFFTQWEWTRWLEQALCHVSKSWSHGAEPGCCASPFFFSQSSEESWNCCLGVFFSLLPLRWKLSQHFLDVVL